MSSGPAGSVHRYGAERTRRPDVQVAQPVAAPAHGHVVGAVDDRGALHVADAAVVQRERPGVPGLVAVEMQRLRVERVAHQARGHARGAVLPGDQLRRRRPAVERQERVAQLLDRLLGVRGVGEPHRQHEAVAEGVAGGLHPHDVVDVAGEEATPGAGQVQVGTAPDHAAGMDPQRLQRGPAEQVDARPHDQHVPVAQPVDVDERDPAAVVVVLVALGVPARDDQPPALEVLGVRGVGGGADALRPPPLGVVVLRVPGEAPRRAASGHPRPGGLTVEVVEH